MTIVMNKFRKFVELTGAVTIENTGAGQEVNNLQPYQVVNYIIALVGIFPSRN